MNTTRAIAILLAIHGSALLALSAVALAEAEQQPPPRPVPTTVWAEKPVKTPPYKPGLKPWVKLADLKAKHKDQATWHEVIVNDGRLTAEYHAAAPGTKVSKRFHPDTREWFAVVEGEVRVEIEGQEPFTATRGSLVNIPRQTIYSVETVGTTPSLRFTLNVSGAKTVFPKEAEPPVPPSAGTAWTEARINRTPGRYDEFNQPHANIHAESAEMWLVFSGKIRYSFEGQQPFIASEGDVVYVPSNTWHATRFIGDNACRLSITEYVGNALLLPPP